MQIRDFGCLGRITLPHGWVEATSLAAEPLADVEVRRFQSPDGPTPQIRLTVSRKVMSVAAEEEWNDLLEADAVQDLVQYPHLLPFFGFIADPRWFCVDSVSANLVKQRKVLRIDGHFVKDNYRLRSLFFVSTSQPRVVQQIDLTIAEGGEHEAMSIFDRVVESIEFLH